MLLSAKHGVVNMQIEGTRKKSVLIILLTSLIYKLQKSQLKVKVHTRVTLYNITQFCFNH